MDGPDELNASNAYLRDTLAGDTIWLHDPTSDPSTQGAWDAVLLSGDGSTAVAINMHAIVAGFLQGMPPFPRRDAVLADMGATGALICGPGSVPTGGLDNRQAGFRARDDGDFVLINGKAGFASGTGAGTVAGVGVTVGGTTSATGAAGGGVCTGLPKAWS